MNGIPGIAPALVVLPPSSILVWTGKAAFDAPAFRSHLDDGQLVAPGHLYRHTLAPGDSMSICQVIFNVLRSLVFLHKVMANSDVELRVI